MYIASISRPLTLKIKITTQLKIIKKDKNKEKSGDRIHPQNRGEWTLYGVSSVNQIHLVADSQQKRLHYQTTQPSSFQIQDPYYGMLLLLPYLLSAYHST